MSPVTNDLIYVCSNCDAQAPKWTGRCLECGAWGSVKEEVESQKIRKSESRNSLPSIVYRLSSFSDSSLATNYQLQATNCPPLDLVLGGGIVPGSVTLLAGEPGIGKSTLLAQVAIAMSVTGGRIVYVTGEESPSQVRRRLARLISKIPETLLFLDETDAAVVAATIGDAVHMMIVDSIQSLRLAETNGEAGSVTQVKACAATITEVAKRSNIPVILAGQVTKDGDVAGPRVLEHLVDTVLFLEGDKDHRYRILRALKHRFGSVDEIALLTMTERGLETVEDPSSELLRDRTLNASGSAVTCLIEGRRPMLLELQALVSPAGYGTPIRRATGVDHARLGMLLAVLAKRAGIFALDKDVYANAAGGIDARDPSCDLALLAAIASAVKDTPLDPKTGLFGEVGLAGELRPVSLPELRLKEFARMGFEKIIVPKGQGKQTTNSVVVKEAGALRDVLRLLSLV